MNLVLLFIFSFSFQKNITVQQNICDDPIAECFPFLTIDVIPVSGEVEVWATDFYSGNQDCLDVFDFRIIKVVDLNRNGQIDLSEYANDNIIDDVLSYSCESLGENFVQLRVSDNQGSFNDCIALLEINDNNNVCSAIDQFSIFGCITTEAGIPVKQVNFNFEPFAGDLRKFQNGECYQYTPDGQVPESIKVIPSKSDNYFVGIDSSDVAAIANHILGRKKIISPYKLIAADVNNSGTITVMDLLALRKVITGRETSFPNNSNWRFIPKSFVFSNPQNPWGTPFPEFGTSDSNRGFGGDSIEFIGIRVGDVE